jgi:hypothetical protein
VGIGDGQEAALDRERCTGESVGVAAAVDTLIVVADRARDIA